MQNPGNLALRQFYTHVGTENMPPRQKLMAIIDGTQSAERRGSLKQEKTLQEQLNAATSLQNKESMLSSNGF